MLTEKDFFGRWVNHPEAQSDDIKKNARAILSKASFLLSMYGKDLVITSGFRPRDYNLKIGGSKNSAHCFAMAIDLWDPDKTFGKWCVNNIEVLKDKGVYMESLVATHKGDDPKKYWVHLQIRRPSSGSQIFMP